MILLWRPCLPFVCWGLIGYLRFFVVARTGLVLFGHFAAKTVIPNSRGDGVAAVTCEQLYSLLYGEDATERTVVMDMRPAADYADSHIRHSDCISVPADCAPLG